MPTLVDTSLCLEAMRGGSLGQHGHALGQHIHDLHRTALRRWDRVRVTMGVGIRVRVIISVRIRGEE